MKNKIKTYGISIAIALAVGGLSAFLTRGNMRIYDEINSPALTPPPILFPIVWTILFILMGIGAARIFEKRDVSTGADTALATYALSLAFNFVWSIIFFNFRAFGLSFFWLIGLFVCILSYTVQYRRIDKTASNLQIPYLLWVAFAGYLNLATWILN